MLRGFFFGAITILLTAGVTVGTAQEQTQPPPPTQTTTSAAEQTEAAPEPTETPRCGDCHDQVAAEFQSNPHARGQLTDGQVGNEVCETCHGDGTEHAQTGDPTKITVPRGLTASNETCLMCHDMSDNRRSHRTGVHANSTTVHCLSCHSIHHAQQRIGLVRQEQLALCGSCHKGQASSLRSRPFTHHTGPGGLTCASCHEPHGRAGRETNRVNAAGESACMSCHRDKRGPHLFPHVSSTFASRMDSARNCWTCHEPHGSNNPKMLIRATTRQLCMECHSTTTSTSAMGSLPPAFHNLNDPRFHHCTTCHVAVHGSNRSPALLK